MKQRSSVGFLITMAIVIGGSAAGATWQWQETAALRLQLDALRAGADELTRLRSENERLRKQQVSTAELEALRADHAALPRLRAEIETLRKGR